MPRAIIAVVENFQKPDGTRAPQSLGDVGFNWPEILK
jgi:hypothetical protein